MQFFSLFSWEILQYTITQYTITQYTITQYTNTQYTITQYSNTQYTNTLIRSVNTSTPYLLSITTLLGSCAFAMASVLVLFGRNLLYYYMHIDWNYFALKKDLRKCQEILMEKFLRLNNFCNWTIFAKIHCEYNHYVTIEIFCDHIFCNFGHLQIFAKKFRRKWIPVYSTYHVVASWSLCTVLYCVFAVVYRVVLCVCRCVLRCTVCLPLCLAHSMLPSLTKEKNALKKYITWHKRQLGAQISLRPQLIDLLARKLDKQEDMVTTASSCITCLKITCSRAWLGGPRVHITSTAECCLVQPLW